MPEGHTIHRYARLHRALLVDRRVGAWSPQGRFTAGAARVDGARVRDVEAHGKRLFYRFVANGGTIACHLSLHAHLGLLDGSASTARTRGHRPLARLVLSTSDAQLHLAGPTACELLDPDGEARLRSRRCADAARASVRCCSTRP